MKKTILFVVVALFGLSFVLADSEDLYVTTDVLFEVTPVGGTAPYAFTESSGCMEFDEVYSTYAVYESSSADVTCMTTVTDSSSPPVTVELIWHVDDDHLNWEETHTTSTNFAIEIEEKGGQGGSGTSGP